MLTQRMLLGGGLGLALLGGVASAAHTSAPVSAHAAGVAHVLHMESVKAATNIRFLAAEPATTETDAAVPCGTDASGSETGNCQDSAGTAGAADSATTETEAITPETDNVQSGDQSTAD